MVFNVNEKRQGIKTLKTFMGTFVPRLTIKLHRIFCFRWYEFRNKTMEWRVESKSKNKCPLANSTKKSFMLSIYITPKSTECSGDATKPFSSNLQAEKHLLPTKSSWQFIFIVISSRIDLSINSQVLNRAFAGAPEQRLGLSNSTIYEKTFSLRGSFFSHFYIWST